ncbi:MAG TPA: hypothetical protein VGT24_07850 [Candidatus Acidoferrales bacterium]|nr:hypothetical protein [Candidatus Acidoferrales bacterium]
MRKSLEEAAFLARDGAYEILEDSLLSFVSNLELADKVDWYLHTLREVIEAMMANPTCDKGAARLGDALRKINRAQRSKPWRAAAASAGQ